MVTVTIILCWQAVELCLRSGAKISTQQHDLSTPVHLACAQGAIDIVKLMFGLQPNEKALSLSSCDVQKMTPLHCAAMFDRMEIVQYLVQEVSCFCLHNNIIRLETVKRIYTYFRYNMCYTILFLSDYFDELECQAQKIRCTPVIQKHY